MADFANIFTSSTTGTIGVTIVGQYDTIADLPSASDYDESTVAWVRASGGAWYRVSGSSWVVFSSGGGGGDMTASEILAELVTVDGAGSGLDADLLDGQQLTYVLSRANHTGTQAASTISDFASAVAAEVDKAYVDALNVDADTLDGVDSTGFATAAHTHDSEDLLGIKGATVKLVYRSSNARWELPDGTVPTLTGREASIIWEGTSAQIPAQGTGDSEFQEGDTAFVRSTTL